MINLIIKDILVQKKTILISLVYTIFFIFTFQGMGNVGFVGSVVAIVYLLLNTSLAYDDKNKSEIMLNSLPIKREDIVTAKYVSVLLYLTIGIGFYFISTLLIKLTMLPIQLNIVTAVDIISSMISVILLSSINLPLFFKLGYIKSKMFSFILFFLFFFGAASLAGYLKNNKIIGTSGLLLDFLYNGSDIQILLFFIIIVFILALVSYGVSIILYKNREF